MSRHARVVLVGAGHAHLYVAANAHRLCRRGAEVILVDPGLFWYSGRATAMLGGQIDAAADRLDPRSVIQRGGGRLWRTRVTAIDRVARRLELASGETLAYDWLSLNVGSVIDSPGITGLQDDPDSWPVKPIANLWALRHALEQRFARGDQPDLAVLGGGATGCEVAANLATLARRWHTRPRLMLIHGGSRLLPTAPRRAALRLQAHLATRGVDVRLRTRIVHRTAGGLICDNGTCLAADTVILASGLAAPAWLAATGLDFDDGICVDSRLRSTSDARIFASGDCARLVHHDLPRLGVFGVRQAPTLLANLAAALSGEPMQSYRPQRRWLSILELGDGTALALRGRLWWHGRSSRWLKQHLDRRFINRYRSRAH